MAPSSFSLYKKSSIGGEKSFEMSQGNNISMTEMLRGDDEYIIKQSKSEITTQVQKPKRDAFAFPTGSQSGLKGYKGSYTNLNQYHSQLSSDVYLNNNSQQAGGHNQMSHQDTTSNQQYVSYNWYEENQENQEDDISFIGVQKKSRRYHDKRIPSDESENAHNTNKNNNQKRRGFSSFMNLMPKFNFCCSRNINTD